MLTGCIPLKLCAVPYLYLCGTEIEVKRKHSTHGICIIKKFFFCLLLNSLRIIWVCRKKNKCILPPQLLTPLWANSLTVDEPAFAHFYWLMFTLHSDHLGFSTWSNFPCRISFKTAKWILIISLSKIFIVVTVFQTSFDLVALAALHGWVQSLRND